jgi:spore maturation protein CgeB
VECLPPSGLEDFDLVLSYTGGRALEELERRLGARAVAPLYGSVDPTVHTCAERRPELAADLSYLGTYAANRKALLQELFLTPARRLPEQTFVIAGAQYPQDFPWEPNVRYVRHLPPADHGAFYSSSRLTLNVTRAPMARLGYCPSARFFEAAACGVPVLTDVWEGLEHFFTPGEEVLVARDADQAVAALSLPAEALERIGRRARERTLAEHTAAHRAAELLRHLEGATVRRRRGEG